MYRITPILTLSLLALLIIGCDSNDDDLPTLSATLTGEAETPDPGDPDGSGSAVVTFDEAAGEVCYDITVSGVETISAAHIHVGEEGVQGDVIVPFNASTGPLEGCVTGVDASDIDDILADPEAYYVNVHNTPYPGGALRGQLRD